MKSNKEMNRLPEWLEALIKVKVLVIGDIMLDRYIFGQVDRISPEAPIPILKVNQQIESLGGAGNVARNLVALGSEVTLVGEIGNDEAGLRIEAILADFKKENKTDELTSLHGKGDIKIALEKRSIRPTIQKTRYIANRQQIMRCDYEDNSPLNDQEQESHKNFLVSMIEKGDYTAIILSDYGKGCLTESLLPILIKCAKQRNTTLIIDPKGRDYSIYQGANYITPNRHELSLASGMPCTNDAEIEKAARSLMDKHNIGCVVATRSEEGMSIIHHEREKPLLHFPAHAKEVYDVAGAGDTVIATLAAGLGAKLRIEDAAKLANLAASVVVAKIGTSVALPEEIINASRQDHFQDQTNKILELDIAKSLVSKWQKQGLKVGFANGCFDLLHPGHISLIHQAKQGCDRLIIGLNSDSSVKKLKGASRPIQTEANRAIVIAALGAVDLVIIFSEETPLDLILALKPDCLIKGKDYKIEQVVGSKEVLSWGGTILLADLEVGLSTTATIQKMSERKK